MKNSSKKWCRLLKNILTGVLTLSLLCSVTGMTAFATSTSDSDTTANAGSSADENGTDKAGNPITVHTGDLDDTVVTQTAEERSATEQAVLAEPVDTNAISGWPQGPGVYAQSAIVMDMKSGAVLYAKNAEQKHYPASITKLLTTLVALQNAEPGDTVTFTEESIDFLEPGDASIGMKAGEEMTLENSLYGVLLASANEVSYAVAESVGTTKLGGSYDTFIEKMNTTAQEIGCENSHWMNANGLHSPEHYTTAHDMARIGAAVYQLDEFKKVTQTLSYEIPSTNIVSETRWVQQNHKMLWPASQYYYENCTGGKTGFTDQAHTTLVTMAQNDQLQLVAVNLRSYGAATYTDTASMLDYGFDNFYKIPLEGTEVSEQIESFEDPEAYIVVPNGVSFSDVKSKITLPENGEEKEGIISYTYNDQEVGHATVVLTDAAYKKLAGLEDDIKLGTAKKASTDDTDKNSEFKISGILRVAAIVVVVLIVLLFIWIQYAKYKRKKARERRRERMRRRHEAEMRARGGISNSRQREHENHRPRRSEERRPRQ